MKFCEKAECVNTTGLSCGFPPKPLPSGEALLCGGAAKIESGTRDRIENGGLRLEWWGAEVGAI